MHSVLSQKNSKFRAVSSGMENCTTSHVYVLLQQQQPFTLKSTSMKVVVSGGLSLAFRAVARVRRQCSRYGMCNEH